MEQHFQGTEKKVEHNKNSDSFAAHFQQHFTKNQIHNNVSK